MGGPAQNDARKSTPIFSLRKRALRVPRHRKSLRFGRGCLVSGASKTGCFRGSPHGWVHGGPETRHPLPNRTLPIEAASPQPTNRTLPIEAASPQPTNRTLPIEAASPQPTNSALLIEAASPQPMNRTLPIEAAPPQSAGPHRCQRSSSSIELLVFPGSRDGKSGKDLSLLLLQLESPRPLTTPRCVRHPLPVSAPSHTAHPWRRTAPLARCRPVSRCASAAFSR